MKIKETIERDCCQPWDMKPYHGAGEAAVFCIHCGQGWVEYAFADEAGAMDTRMERVTS